MRRIGPMLVVLSIVYLAGCGEQPTQTVDRSPSEASTPVNIGKPLYAAKIAAPKRQHRVSPTDPIVLHDCRLAVIDRQDVPCQREGVLLVMAPKSERMKK